MTLPTTVTVREFGMYLPDDVPLMADEALLDVDVTPESLTVRLTVTLDRLFAELVEEAELFEAIELPPDNGFVETSLELELVSRDEVTAPYVPMFRDAADPEGLFLRGPMPEGADYSPLHAMASYELVSWAVVTRQTGTDDEVAYAGQAPE